MEMVPRKEVCSISSKGGCPSKFWMLCFDGSKSKQGVGASFKLISPSSKTFFVTFKLQFYCTNNIVEYEALVHRLLMELRKRVKMLPIFGDSKLVVRHVRKLYSCDDQRFNSYRNRVWDLIEGFDAFNI